MDIIPLRHPLVVVLTADCDLEHDSSARSQDRPDDARELIRREYETPALIPYVLLCDAFLEGQIRGRAGASDLWRRIKQNQDERYHRLAAAPYGFAPWFGKLPDLYLDFKKMLALPTEQLYDGVTTGGIRRVAAVPPVYVHRLMHRFFGFLSRVGVPD